MNYLTQQEIIALCGVDAVLIPIPSKQKFPSVKGWQKTSFNQTLEANYQRKLTTHSNTGILLGRPSQNLVSIDIDDPVAAEEFLARNPWHSHTLRTNSRRGFNLWLIIEGQYPERCYNLTSDSGSGHIGEWRGGGGALTVFQGIHPSGAEYTITQNFPPIRMSYESINWANLKPECYINDINDTNDTKEGKRHQSTNRTKSLIEKLESTKSARENLKNNTNLWKLYKEYIKRRYIAEQGQRNSQLVAMTTYLTFNTSDKVTFSLIKAFYDLNEDVFSDSRGQHIYEASEHHENTKERWLKSLNLHDRCLLEDLPDLHRQAFRILRNLAGLKADDSPHGSFYISCNQLALRLGISLMKASRLLKQFQALHIIKLTEKGDRYQTGRRAKASGFQWLLELPPQQSNGSGKEDHGQYSDQESVLNKAAALSGPY